MTSTATITTNSVNPNWIEIPEGTLMAKNAAFMVILCKTYQPYLTYEDPALDCARDTVIPRALMMLRYDSTVGFPGGIMDAHETPKDAVIREVTEEVNFDVTPYLDQIKHLCSHKNLKGTMGIHTYIMEVDPEVFDSIPEKARTAKHFTAECNGIMTPNIYWDPNGAKRGIPTLRTLPYAGPGALELEKILQYMGLDTAPVKE